VQVRSAEATMARTTFAAIVRIVANPKTAIDSA
jgi:hypothetical protein